ncbi:MAG: histidine phosphatase family protein [Candidatus Taylorbacteria bacterium]
MIYFIRHGESEANLKHTFAGQKDDSILTEKGRKQALDEGNKIKELGINIDTIVSSPLKRALSTAHIVAEAIGHSKEIIVDPRITEYDMGDLTGTPTFEITSRQMATGKNAEDTKLFLNRVKSFLDEYSKKDENILMVCHAGVGRIIETMKTGGDPILFYDLPAYPNAEVIKLDWLK